MAYPRAFKQDDPETPTDLFTIYPSDEEGEIEGDGLAVGDSVRMLRGKRKGEIGVIVRASFFTYVVDPYNDPYYNDPRNVTKLGPFCANELVKVKRPKNASTVYKRPVAEAQDEAPVVEVEQAPTERTPVREVRGKKGAKVKRKSRRGKLTREQSEEPMKVNAKQKARYMEQIEKVIEFKGADNIAVLKELPYISEKLFGKPLMLDWIRKVGNGTVEQRGKYNLAKIKEVVNAIQPEVKERKRKG